MKVASRSFSLPVFPSRMTLTHCPASLLTPDSKAHTGEPWARGDSGETPGVSAGDSEESILSSSIKDMFFWRYFTEILKLAKSPDC